MKDRYLYRAKRTDNGEFIEGLLTIMWGQLHIINPDDENTAYPIDESTICQCTGLKDKNGKLIWENDIVKEEFKAIGVVHYGMHDYNIGFNIKWVNEYGWAYRREVCYWANKVEIIGNTIDNPELLEVGE